MTDPAFFKTVYDREACEIGMIHIGFGAFHRAHQAVYVDDYMQATGDLRWGIAAVNLRAADSASFAKAAEADEGYLLKSISPDGTLEFRAVRSHLAFVDAAQNLEDALELFARAKTCATTITVTESGYTFNEDWSLDLEAPSIQADLSATHPQTIYGFLALALKRRMETANAPMTIMCCDNIRNNGRV
ncbi:MAG: mannitol dehydrogenase family protein, partial [Pseudomonadota bacterium]